MNSPKKERDTICMEVCSSFATMSVVRLERSRHPGRVMWLRRSIISAKDLHFFSLRVTPASLSSRHMRSTCWIWFWRGFEKTIIPFQLNRCYLPAYRGYYQNHWFPKRGWGVSRAEWLSDEPVWTVAVCEYRLVAIALVTSSYQYPELASSVENTVFSPKLSVHSSMKGKQYELRKRTGLSSW